MVPKAPAVLIMYAILAITLAFAFYLFDVVRSVYSDIKNEHQNRPNAPKQNEVPMYPIQA